MRKLFLSIAVVSLAWFSCGQSEFEAEDIENNTATAEQPKNTHKGPFFFQAEDGIRDSFR